MNPDFRAQQGERESQPERRSEKLVRGKSTRREERSDAMAVQQSRVLARISWVTAQRAKAGVDAKHFQAALAEKTKTGSLSSHLVN